MYMFTSWYDSIGLCYYCTFNNYKYLTVITTFFVLLILLHCHTSTFIKMLTHLFFGSLKEREIGVLRAINGK